MKDISIRIGLFLISGILFLAGGYYFKNAMHFKNESLQTSGRIVALYREGPRGVRLPIFEYQVDGKIYQKKSSYGSSSNPSLGDEVEVLYWPSNPKNAFINNWGNFYGFPAMLVGGALIVLFLGIKLPPPPSDPQ